MANTRSMSAPKMACELVKSNGAGRCVNTRQPLTQPSASTEQEGYSMVANHTPLTPRNGVNRG